MELSVSRSVSKPAQRETLFFLLVFMLVFFKYLYENLAFMRVADYFVVPAPHHAVISDSLRTRMLRRHRGFFVVSRGFIG